ncbi:hypothetical protein L1987_02111 [Smallanthus sonchifolius]|uniref:Uncharacterized protein n=1 Tax=Smallanthus sonchifolius TaxID=185202 RepID=A0ACB9K6X5_9ASTR|nr:hypothetical protein L1987_02111 [Smallanthus sonchifolius]
MVAVVSDHNPKNPLMEEEPARKHVREDTPPVANESNSVHTDERVVLEPTTREAITNEVYQVIHNTMPEIMAEALKEGHWRKGKEPESIIRSDEDSEGVYDRGTAMG